MTPSSAFTFKPNNLSVFSYTLAPQNSNPPAAAATTMDHRHCIDFCLPLHRRSIQPIILSAHYFEVIKKCFLLSLISIYCYLSIHFNFSWNFVSLWLWVVLDLSFFFFFHGILLVCGCGLLWIYLFIFLADFHVFFFFLCCQIYGKEES